ncbi:MAG: hypothetical protein H8Z69_00470 [Nanohaloarchaea archaeon]|nr:hypothetical protein [Candidatus Nanohaloarchaea archaeon]
MKGQTVNIDWSIGLGLMIVTLLSSIIFLSSYQTGGNTGNLENIALETSNQLISETSSPIGRKSLIMESPNSISNVPVDRRHFFNNYYRNASLKEQAAELHENRTIMILDKTDSTREINLYAENLTGDLYSDIEINDWMNNSFISVMTGGNGLESMRINGKEVLSSSADLGIGTFDIKNNLLHAELEDAGLKIYNNSKEIIIENASGLSFRLKNMSKLYWAKDDSTTELAGTGLFKDGKTSGFTVASNYGISFIGKLNAKVSKPDSSTVLAEIDSERLRIRLHDKDHSYGKKRINSYKQGRIVFGPLESFSTVSVDKIKNLNNKSNQDLEEALDISPENFNLSISDNSGKLASMGYPTPLQEVVSRQKFLTGFYRNGSLTDLEMRLNVW